MMTLDDTLSKLLSAMRGIEQSLGRIADYLEADESSDDSDEGSRDSSEIERDRWIIDGPTDRVNDALNQ